MIWTAFKETNLMLGAGNNPNTGDLPIAISLSPRAQGVAFCVSKWKMTPEEKEHFLKTGEIWLSIMAPLNHPTQPPVSLCVFNPFTDYGNDNDKAINFLKGHGYPLYPPLDPLDPVDLMK